MPDLFLHIGQTKTGSSAIQDFLFHNTALLAEFGIDYPPPPPPPPQNRHTDLPFGATNLIAPAGVFNQWDALILKHCRTAAGEADLLFSGEWVFEQISRAPQRLARLVEGLPASFHLKAMLYLREVVPHFRSAYLQRVKDPGFGGTPADFLAYYCAPCEVLGCIKTLRSLGVDVTIRKYRAEGLLADFGDWLLGERADAFLARAAFIDAPANRSLTRGEAELLRQISRACAEYPYNLALSIGRRLFEQAPEVAAEPPYLSAALLAELKEKFAGTVAEINELVEPEQRLSTDFSLPEGTANRPDSGVYRFNQKQLALIARGIAEAPVMPLLMRLLRYKARIQWLMRTIRDPRRLMQAAARRLRTRWREGKADGR